MIGTGTGIAMGELWSFHCFPLKSITEMGLHFFAGATMRAVATGRAAVAATGTSGHGAGNGEVGAALEEPVAV